MGQGLVPKDFENLGEIAQIGVGQGSCVLQKRPLQSNLVGMMEYQSQTSLIPT